jgi:hypothetical protein
LIKETQTAEAVESCVEFMQSLNVRDAVDMARTRWMQMLDAKSFPADEQITGLIVNLQFPTIRDQLMADIPGIDEPMDRVLLAQTDSKPHWSRAEWAEQLLLHAYTRIHTQQHRTLRPHPHRHRLHQLVARGSKARQFLQLALEADSGYYLARLSDQMTCSGSVAMSCRCPCVPA